MPISCLLILVSKLFLEAIFMFKTIVVMRFSPAALLSLLNIDELTIV